MSNLRSADLTEAFTQQLSLSKVEPGEHVVVLSEPNSRQDFVSAAFAAAKSLGAHVLSVVAPGGAAAPVPATHTGAGPGLTSVLEDKVAQNVMKDADLVVDLTYEGFIHAPVQNEVLESGTRIIFVCDTPEVLIRNMPKAEDKQRVLAGQELVNNASQMRITSPAGTDLTVDLVNVQCDYQVGFADDKGRWDHWPSTMVLCWPEISDGTIVLAPGDIVMPFKEYVQDDVTLTIKEGHIEKIEGKADAKMIERYFEDIDDKWGRYLSHMGWGLMKNADWFAQAMYSKHEVMGMDARGFAGNFLWSTGPHPVLKRESYAHLDVAMRDCTITLDEKPVVVDGALATE
jgi:2,5-dihydroxypyridine 5,6-dioxygenase